MQEIQWWWSHSQKVSVLAYLHNFGQSLANLILLVCMDRCRGICLNEAPRQNVVHLEPVYKRDSPHKQHVPRTAHAPFVGAAVVGKTVGSAVIVGAEVTVGAELGLLTVTVMSSSAKSVLKVPPEVYSKSRYL